MNIIKCQGVNCEVRLSCSRYYPLDKSFNEGSKFVFLARNLHKFFKTCLFLKKK